MNIRGSLEGFGGDKEEIEGKYIGFVGKNCASLRVKGEWDSKT